MHLSGHFFRFSTKTAPFQPPFCACKTRSPRAAPLRTHPTHPQKKEAAESPLRQERRSSAACKSAFLSRND